MPQGLTQVALLLEKITRYIPTLAPTEMPQNNRQTNQSKGIMTRCGTNLLELARAEFSHIFLHSRLVCSLSALPFIPSAIIA